MIYRFTAPTHVSAPQQGNTDGMENEYPLTQWQQQQRKIQKLRAKQQREEEAAAALSQQQLDRQSRVLGMYMLNF